MKSETHDKEMVDVYDHIYADFYNLEPIAVERAHTIIKKNLAELGIFAGHLAGLNVLNIGTGREVFVFHQLGAQEIYHFDISSRPVKNLQELSRKDGFGNIHSKLADVCNDGALGLDGQIGLVYLSGVLHHLHSTGVAVENITRSLQPGSRLFFRVYRSGSLGFFVVDFIRKLISYADFQLTSQMAAERFGNTEDPAGLYADVIDDFFVPVLKLFDPRQVDNFFMRSGFKVLTERQFSEYDHSDTGQAGQGCSLYYEYLGRDASQLLLTDFPGHIDQLHGINYSETFIKKTVVMMDAVLAQIGQMSTSSRIKLALQLFEVSQAYRRKVNASVAQKNHEKLQEILGNFLHSKLE